MDYRAEIAASAARMIAEDGLDYASAKRKALEQLAGGRRSGASRVAKELLPSNEEIEEAVREYQQLYQADTQPQRLHELRVKALSLMTLLKDFSPTVTGAIANGTAGEFSDIHLQCFADSAKDLGIFLLNQNIDFDATTLPHFRGSGGSGGPHGRGGSGRGQEVEALVIRWQGELASIAVYSHLDERGAMKPNAKGQAQRLDAKMLATLLAESAPNLDP